MKNKNIIWVIVIVVILLGLMMWGRTASEDAAGYWGDTSVLCLPLGHANLAYHIHPTLDIFVDGEEEAVPANIGISNDCMAEIHTHDATGKIHVETATAGREISLSDFFDVWEESLERPGFDAEVTVRGETISDLDSYIPKDLDPIEIRYTSTEGGEEEPNDSATTSESTDEQSL